jgi:hypothetical protein
MRKFGAAMGDEASGGLRNREWGRSGVYRARSKAGYGGMGANGINPAAGTRNVAGGPFLISVVKETIGTGRGRHVGPVDVVVSALDTDVEEGEVLIVRLT